MFFFEHELPLMAPRMAMNIFVSHEINEINEMGCIATLATERRDAERSRSQPRNEVS